jgi:hypothetical protein
VGRENSLRAVLHGISLFWLAAAETAHCRRPAFVAEHSRMGYVVSTRKKERFAKTA